MESRSTTLAPPPPPPDLPRLRRRILLIGLPFAGGAGLVLHILAGVSLPLAIGALALLAVAVWVLVLRRLAPAARRAVYRRLRIGALSGLIGTVAYDLARYGLVSVFSMSFKPFHVFSIFGELFIGSDHGGATIFLVGLLYHLSNGTFFGAAYTIVFRRPAWWTGALWGIGLELCMATLYPSWLRMQAVGEFYQVSAFGHVIYGSVLGTVAGRLVARSGPGKESAGPTGDGALDRLG